MLHLKSSTSARWMEQVRAHLPEILIDHAHCEKKAAATAMNLMVAYIDHEELCREMSVIVQEELEHFFMVLDLMKERKIRFRRLRPSRYAGQLHQAVRKQEPHRAVDRLLVAGIIEARSCERFDVLRQQIEDPQLAAFYDSLFESEARHHSSYVRLAKHYASESEVMDRLEELMDLEAEILAEGDPLPRMHS